MLLFGRKSLFIITGKALLKRKPYYFFKDYYVEKYILGVDSEMVTSWLKSDAVPRLSFGNLVEKCRRLINGLWEVQVVHLA